ncbi:reverse transcriptase (RNA-dependent DNA polymerase) [Paraburkholderia sp. BL18I3N2]|nr:reverse transcriptase (RNA-dependent DNA polymerase) [Paraburkholderia sp. BL18I3N2]PRX92577.1 reverse transcriptase (RNA-dependent DNA polymerase) [Paraburkholderia sp. BL25I1N1]
MRFKGLDLNLLVVLDALMTERNLTAAARSKAQLNVVRYADDFIVTGMSKEVLEFEMLPAVRQFMAAQGLERSEEKSRITNIADGFDFLGQNVRKYDGYWPGACPLCPLEERCHPATTDAFDDGNMSI